MSFKSSAAASLASVATAATAVAQPSDKWLPGGVRQVFQAVTVLTNAQILAMGTAGAAGVAGAMQVVPAPPAGTYAKIIDFRLVLSDIPAAPAYNGTIGGQSGFSTNGMNTAGGGGAAAAAALATGTTCQLQYSAPGAANTANNYCSTNVTAAIMNAAPAGFPIVAGGTFIQPVIPIPAATAICLTNAGGNYTGGGNVTLTVIVNYEILSARL